MIQMFNHGINIIGLWIVVDLIERQFHTRKISELGGLAQKAPALAILLVIVALANIALPLTNAFVGEFLMFNGVFSSTATTYNVVFTVVAAYQHYPVGRVYAEYDPESILWEYATHLLQTADDIRLNEKIVLAVIVVVIIVIGVYPKPMLDLTKDTVDAILTKMNYKL